MLESMALAALKLSVVPGDLPAIATPASIEAARCAWRWQAGGRLVAGGSAFSAVDRIW